MSENIALIGADPEIFVTGTVKDGRGRPTKYGMMPAFGLFGGNKDKPNKMTDLPDGYMYLEDNAALEFNIPPQKTSREFVEAIATAKQWMSNNLLDDRDMAMSDRSVLELEPKFLADPRALEVGCLPDHDAYLGNGEQRDRFNADKLGNKRYAGAHIHLQYNCAIVPQYVAARFLDLYLSLPWLEFDRQYERRPIYGKAGLFRAKDYGIEYRTLSNFWLWNGDGLQAQLAESALTFARRSYDTDYLHLLSAAFEGMPWNDVQRAIESEDLQAANQLIELADRTYSLNIRSRPRRR